MCLHSQTEAAHGPGAVGRGWRALPPGLREGHPGTIAADDLHTVTAAVTVLTTLYIAHIL